MDIVHKLLNTLATIIFVFLLSSFAVSAAEAQLFKELPKGSEIKPAPPPGGSILPPSVTIRKSSQMSAPGARKQTPIIVEQMQRLGYREVSDESMSFFHVVNAKTKFIPIEEITNNVSSALSVISNKPGIFQTMQLVGAIPRGPEKKTGKWTHVSRYFSLVDGRTLMLAESDYKAARYSVTIPEEMLNEKVNGSPAILTTKKTTSGKFFTELSWFTENKTYALHLTGRAVGVGIKNELVALATGIQQP